MNEYISLALLLIVVVQQVFFMWQIQKLVDKLMSRSYTEYIKAGAVEPPKVTLPDAPLEDMRVLGEFQPV